MKHTFSRRFLLFATIFSFAIIVFAQANQVSAQVNGAVFTTNSACDGTNLNIFSNKDAVYLDGGPRKAGSAVTEK